MPKQQDGPCLEKDCEDCFPKETESQKNDLQKADQLKLEANELFKSKNLDDACKKYQSAISVLRTNLELKGTKKARDIEIACRGNIALCKLTQKQFEDAIEHCERILDIDPKNVKASYRMAQAMYELSKGEHVPQIESALKYA